MNATSSFLMLLKHTETSSDKEEQYTYELFNEINLISFFSDSKMYTCHAHIGNCDGVIDWITLTNTGDASDILYFKKGECSLYAEIVNLRRRFFFVNKKTNIKNQVDIFSKFE